MWDFKSFSVILASFDLKLAILGGKIEVNGVQYFKLQFEYGDSG